MIVHEPLGTFHVVECRRQVDAGEVVIPRRLDRFRHRQRVGVLREIPLPGFPRDLLARERGEFDGVGVVGEDATRDRTVVQPVDVGLRDIELRTEPLRNPGEELHVLLTRARCFSGGAEDEREVQVCPGLPNVLHGATVLVDHGATDDR